ncbi:MAG: helix-turn-helix domain-containing protein [Oscillospiraceae bacterium]|jgi:DNA gyrase subunit B|nr:helix-turn-helix domain-containing protein [Oscillospiraceae bacterium]
MSRNLEQEMDAVKKELEELKSLLLNRREDQPKSAGRIHKSRGMHPDPAIMSILDRLENACGSTGETGRITYLGVFSSGGRQSTWIKNEINTDELLGLIETRTAEKVLTCIGNNDRLNLLLALLRQPMTVAALVEKCGYNSTGQVYHHLKPLIAADLVTEDKDAAKGTYSVVPHRVQGIIMLLAGVHDMTDVQYSTGNWDADNNETAGTG